MKQLNNETITPTHFESLYPPDTRSVEIEKALGYIKQGKSCQIIALPGVGRSTLLGLLAYNKSVRIKHLGSQEKDYHFVMSSFSEVRKRPLIDVTKFLFLNLIDSLRDRELTDDYNKTKAIFQEALKTNDELVMFQGLKQAIDLLTAEKNMTVIFLFDLFEEYLPMLTADFFNHLRTLRNRAKYQFSVIFSLNRPLEDIIEPAMMTEFYDFVVGNHVYLPLHDQPGLDHRIKALEEISGKKVDKKILEEVMKLTGGFTREVKICLETILSAGFTVSGNEASIVKRKEVSVKDDNRNPQTKRASLPTTDSPHQLGTFLLSHKPVQRPLFEIWKSLTPAEQQVVIQISSAETGNYTPHPNPLLPGEGEEINYLRKVDLLHDNTITIPLFTTFITDYLKPQQGNQPATMSFVYDEATNEIKHGETVVSDNLTSSEFRMLRYLIQHPDRVIEREELINAVWHDTASTAGVTDQALDQLIFRVRRKIEDDPNNPAHIQTVKGRGVRFVIS